MRTVFLGTREGKSTSSDGDDWYRPFWNCLKRVCKCCQYQEESEQIRPKHHGTKDGSIIEGRTNITVELSNSSSKVLFVLTLTFRALALHQSRWRRANARDVSFETLYGGLLMLLTQFIICTKYPVILPLRRSPKVYLELAPFLHRQTTFRKVGFTSGNSRDIFGNCLF